MIAPYQPSKASTPSGFSIPIEKEMQRIAMHACIRNKELGNVGNFQTSLFAHVVNKRLK